MKNDDGLCDEFALEQINRRVEVSISSNKKLVFLVLSGSFNPVHTQHTALLILSKTYLEKSGWNVIGGFLAPTTDEHLSAKLGEMAMPLARRIELCKLAIEGMDWLNVCKKGERSSKWACIGIRVEIVRYCSACLPDCQLQGVEIMGSDAALVLMRKILDENKMINRLQKQVRIICCFIRFGCPIDDKQYLGNVLAPGVERLGINLIILSSIHFNFLLRNVSSTNIRSLIKQSQWKVLQSEGLLHLSVLKALKSAMFRSD